MDLLRRPLLEDFALSHADIRGPLRTWIEEVEDAHWQTSMDIKTRYVSASFLANDIVIFNIKGKKYRLETKVVYKREIVVARRIETHADYSKR